MSAYGRASARIDNTTELLPYRSICLHDWDEGDDHYDWVATAPVHEIVEWAQSISQDEATQRVEEYQSNGEFPLLTTADVAQRLGVSDRRVRQLASSRRVGWQITRGTWVFAEEHIERLRPGPRGRPAGR